VKGTVAAEQAQQKPAFDLVIKSVMFEYNRTAHLPERRMMMQQWTDYLDKLRQGK
jgi:hypothetical protein